MAVFIEEGKANVLTFSIIPTTKPIVSAGALYLLSIQIIEEIVISPAVNLRSDNSRISVTTYYWITFDIKICDHRTRFIVFIR